MKNNKGFTVVELMTTFILITIISTFLINLVISMKELYIYGDVKTTLLTKQGILTDKIMKDLNDNSIVSFTSCGNTCINFSYIDGTSKKLKIDKEKKSIMYDNYSIKLGDNGSFGNIYTLNENDIIQIKIEINNKLVKGDYGLNIVFPINDKITFDNSIVELFK